MLRIIAGKYRHLIIEAPSTNTTRPTTDKVREAVMSSLGTSLIDATILDLFAGSGALGLEALSRGAKKAIFCDNNYLAIKTIKDNINKLKISEEVEIYKCSYKEALNQLKEKNEIIFLDPPYIKENVYQEVCDFLFDNNLLSNNAIIVKEWNKQIPIDNRFNHHKSYSYGTINILIERR